jgi:6-phosphofructo-2-kinase/fructose-2,6-biphosphatase 4
MYVSSTSRNDSLTRGSAPRSEPTNVLRKRIKAELEDQIWDFFTVQGGQVVIYDANNGDINARQECLNKFESRGVHVIFLGRY